MQVPGGSRPIGKLVGLVDRQRIHVRPQSDRRAIASSENADHARLANVAMNPTAKFGKLTGNKLGGAVLLEAKLGVRMQVSPPRGHLVMKGLDSIRDLPSDLAQLDDWARAMRCR
jgi:hypothetical protein